MRKLGEEVDIEWKKWRLNMGKGEMLTVPGGRREGRIIKGTNEKSRREVGMVEGRG